MALSDKAKPVLRTLLGALMILIGVQHFRDPDPFIKIVPAALPEPRMLVLVSGAFEILGGVGILVPPTRRFAGWGLIALYVAVFPANVNMAINNLPLGDKTLPPALLWARLPLQLVFILWAWWVTRPEPRK